MSELHYLSMNSSLARIFAEGEALADADEESWEKESFQEKVKIKEESNQQLHEDDEEQDSDKSEAKKPKMTEEYYDLIVKKEPEEAESSEGEWEEGEYSESEDETIDDSYYDLAKVKQEPKNDEVDGIKPEVDLSKVKQEAVKGEIKEGVKRMLKRVHDDGGNKSEENTCSKTKSSGSSTFSENNNRKRQKVEYETDPEVLKRRQKQIDYGKNTKGYDNYLEQVPRGERKKTDPMTPNKYLKYSRRAWDGLIKHWRIKLHYYDPSA